MSKANTQKKEALYHMERGTRLTPMRALEWFGCFRLAAVVHRLRKEGHNVQSEQVPGESYHAYWIPR